MVIVKVLWFLICMFAINVLDIPRLPWIGSDIPVAARRIFLVRRSTHMARLEYGVFGKWMVM